MKLIRNIFFLLGFFSIVHSSNAQGIIWFRDFEGWIPCGTGCGQTCALYGGTLNETSDSLDWLIDSTGTSTPATGPDVDHTFGTSTGTYLYVEASCANIGYPDKVAIINNQLFDFTLVSHPVFEFWYHMYGNTMGTIAIDVDTGNGWILDVLPPFTDSVDLWQKMRVDLLPFAGSPIFYFRIRGVTGSDERSDMAIDDLTLFDNPPVDLEILSISSPASGCGLDSELVTFTIKSFGEDTLFAGDSIPYSFTVGGNTTLDTLILVADLPPNQSLIVTSNYPAVITTPGLYQITIQVNHPSDTYIILNQTLSKSFWNYKLVTQFPYTENFETGNGDWFTEGVNSSWQWGTPANDFISKAAGCGSNAWVTNLTGNYNNSEDSWVLSPCFDFSSFGQDPVVALNLIYNTQNLGDKGWIEISTDVGDNWTILGTGLTGINWYDDLVNHWWSGSSGTGGFYKTSNHALSGTAGSPNVLLRFRMNSDIADVQEGFGFDNISIVPNFDNLNMVSIDGPPSGCTMTQNETVSFTIQNSGDTIINAFNVCYLLDGLLTCEFFTQTLNAGDMYSDTFATLGDFSIPGYHSLQVFTSLATDDLICDDTLYRNVINSQLVNQYPYFESWENGPAGWEIYGTNASWQLGTPTKNIIVGAADGVNAWVTGGTGTSNYNAAENSKVESSCFDFTNLPPGSMVGLKVWWESEFSFDGACLQYSTDDGNSWASLGANGDPNNWFNDGLINGNPGGQGAGWTGRVNSGNGSNGWVLAKHNIPAALFGQTLVRFRIAFGSDASVEDDGFGFDAFGVGIPSFANLGNDTTVCGGYILGADINGTSYLWSTGATTPTIQLFNADTIPVTDTIWVVQTDFLGTVSTDTIIITVNPAPYIVIADTIGCTGDTITLDAGIPGLIYLWSNGDTSQTSAYIVPVLAYVDVQDSSGGCIYTDSVWIDTWPVADLGNDVLFCNGQNYVLNPGNGFQSYLWSDSSTGSTLLVDSAGTYYVTVTTVQGCVSSDSITFTPPAAITASFTFSVAGLNVAFTNNSTGPITNQTWTFGDGGQSGGLNPSHTYPTYGSYTVWLYVYDICGNVDSVSQTVDILASINEDVIGSLSIFPNPNEGSFNIDASEIVGKELKVSVEDLSGKEIMKFIYPVSGGMVHAQVDMSGVSDGMYFLRMETQGGVVIEKIIKK